MRVVGAVGQRRVVGQDVDVSVRGVGQDVDVTTAVVRC